MIIFETPRLLLRRYTAEDSAAMHTIFSDPAAMAFYPAPFSLQQTRNWIQRNLDRYENDGYGLWAVCLKETGECIGDCGLIQQQINGMAEVEIGYHISPQHWRKGYASEAAQACKEYGFNVVGLDKLISIIDPRNTASIGVAEKIGFIKEREAMVFNKNHWIYAGFR